MNAREVIDQPQLLWCQSPWKPQIDQPAHYACKLHQHLLQRNPTVDDLHINIDITVQVMFDKGVNPGMLQDQIPDQVTHIHCQRGSLVSHYINTTMKTLKDLWLALTALADLFCRTYGFVTFSKLVI